MFAAVLKDNPPNPDDTNTIEKLKRIGIEVGKDFDLSKVDPAILRGINRAPAEVWYKLETGPYTAPTVNGWQNVRNIGRFGTDYTTRAFVAWFGLGALTSDAAVYPSAFVDGDGNVLDGAAKYVLHLEKDEIFPSESGVWSVSPYRENFYVKNAINRYGITSAMPLKYNPDGSLAIYIQAQSPGADKEANRPAFAQPQHPGLSAKSCAEGRGAPSAASKICARLSLRAACLPPPSIAVSSSRSAWLNSTR